MKAGVVPRLASDSRWTVVPVVRPGTAPFDALDAEGRVNFVELNPLPGLSPGWSDLCLIAASANLDYRALIGRILAPAIRRFRANAAGARTAR